MRHLLSHLDHQKTTLMRRDPTLPVPVRQWSAKY
jgi:hypothetical protein